MLVIAKSRPAKITVFDEECFAFTRPPLGAAPLPDVEPWSSAECRPRVFGRSAHEDAWKNYTPMGLAPYSEPIIWALLGHV